MHACAGFEQSSLSADDDPVARFLVLLAKDDLGGLLSQPWNEALIEGLESLTYLVSFSVARQAPKQRVVTLGIDPGDDVD